MEYKPSDFPVGAVDFFSTILPGAFLCYLCRDLAERHLFGSAFPAIKSESEGWVIFVLSSYLVGQFVALLGAAFVDNLYDYTYLPYKRRRGDKRYLAARALQGEYTNISTTLQWTSAYLRLRNPVASLEMDHFEAGSKFFRSMVVVLIIASMVFFYSHKWIQLWSSLLLTIFSFWRFGHLRWKFSELAFVYFIELKMYPELTPTSTSNDQDSGNGIAGT